MNPRKRNDSQPANAIRREDIELHSLKELKVYLDNMNDATYAMVTLELEGGDDSYG